MRVAFLVQVNEPEHEGDQFWANTNVYMNLIDAQIEAKGLAAKGREARIVQLSENPDNPIRWNYPAKPEKRVYDDVMFNVTCKMRRRWVDHFCSLLKEMQSFGRDGHSGVVKFYSDGDGDFRPEFGFGTNFEEKKPNSRGEFDAG